MNGAELVSDKVLQWMEAVETTAAEQLPLVCEEIIAWKIAMGWAGAAVVVLSILAVAVATGLVNWAYRDNYSRWDNTWFSFGISSVCALLPLLIGAFMVMDGVKAYLAPRLVILDQLKEML
jgi:hypothetical protein